ncbi:MAG: aminotransferase class I/II-fold pyridoxal phosphate-dependent enzyme, partial [Sedimentisphaerales bacterium]|nr:aminotransferase class I/II-fold pyridoxal phosphate-dependent enzyme [Sedimentisphaerales bacterium]
MLFEPAQRLQALPTYLFVEIGRRKQAAIAAGKDVIDFGVGATDLPTPDFIINRMKQALDNPVNHRYAFDEPSAAIRHAFAAYFQLRYGQTLDPQREIRQLIGSKEGIGHLPLAIVNPGRVVLVPEPGYPVYRSATLLAGGEPYTMELSEVTDWLPDLESIPEDVARNAALMFINYPNNPTGALASLDFFAEVIDFAKRHDIIVAQDAAYNDLYFGDPPPSILQVPGAIDVAVEFHSTSKTFN